MRAAWPSVLERVLQARRFAWILLSQNAEPIEVRDDMLTIGFTNPGARDSFISGGSQQLLAQAVADTTGRRMRINAVVAGPSVTPTPSPAPDTRRAGAEGVASGNFVEEEKTARSERSKGAPVLERSVSGARAQKSSGAGAPAAERFPDPAAPADSAAPDDVALYDEVIADIDPAELLSVALGAELIAEEDEDV